MVATEINVGEILAQASATEKKELLHALVKDLFARFGCKRPFRIADTEGKVITYIVPPRVKTQLPLLEDCPEEFEAEMKRRKADPRKSLTPEQVDATIQAKYGPFECDIPLPGASYSPGDETLTKCKTSM